MIIVLDEDDDLEDLSIVSAQQKTNDISSQTKTCTSNEDSIAQASSKSLRCRKKRKNKPPIPSPRPPSPIHSPLSRITFNQISNILTISRMGSIYYCVEDIYMKIFSPLCKLDELICLLIKPELVLLKEVTLSEKLCLTRENPRLKRLNSTRYRLISIDASDYLLKIKQALLANKRINQIIAEMRLYKQTSTSHSSHEKTKHLSPPGTKRPSTDDSTTNKRQKTLDVPQTPSTAK